MRSYRIDEFCGPSGLRFGEEETPRPGRGQILIRLKAASLNFRDNAILQGMFGPAVRSGIVPLSDGAGVVEAVGEDVHRFAAGDGVMPIFNPHWIGGKRPVDAPAIGLGGDADGTLADYIVVDQVASVPIPEHLSFEEAACLPCAGVTAWSALCGGEPLYPGETVLTLGTGGVSVFALQFAKLFGARVIATSSQDDKCERLRALGADATINYRTCPDWDREVRRLTDGRGADVVVEIGGAGTLGRSFRASSPNARISIVGMLAGTSGGDGFDFMSWLATTYRTSVGSRQDFEQMNRAISYHKTKPVVDRVFRFEDAVEAFEFFNAKQYFGKVVISID